MIELNIEEKEKKKIGASLKVIGIGGGGCNAVNSMITSGQLDCVDFIVANTDAQSLECSKAENKIQIGSKITKGLGAGSDPEIGRRAAEEDIESVLKHISDADILFLTSGLGGGTGSGALPVVARAAREAGVLSVAVVTKPFLFEGKRRMMLADESISSLRDVVDTFIIVPNEKLLEISDPNISMLDAFAMANEILLQAISGIANIITRPGHINVDFADVRSVMKDMGMAIMGTGQCSGEGRAKEAVMRAINSPLLETVGIEGAKGVLLNITGNTDLGLKEIHEAAKVIYDSVSEDANIILGSVIDPNMGDELMVTVIATGFDEARTDVSKVVAASKADQPKADVAIQREVPKPDDVGRLDESASYVDEPKFEAASEKKEAPDLSDNFDLDDIDTPAFLRKKAEEESESNL